MAGQLMMTKSKISLKGMGPLTSIWSFNFDWL